MNVFENKYLLALQIVKLPNFKLRDFDCDTKSQAIGWLKSLDLRDVKDIYSDMYQDYMELR